MCHFTYENEVTSSYWLARSNPEDKKKNFPAVEHIHFKAWSQKVLPRFRLFCCIFQYGKAEKERSVSNSGELIIKKKAAPHPWVMPRTAVISRVAVLAMQQSQHQSTSPSFTPASNVLRAKPRAEQYYYCTSRQAGRSSWCLYTLLLILSRRKLLVSLCRCKSKYSF